MIVRFLALFLLLLLAVPARAEEGFVAAQVLRLEVRKTEDHVLAVKVQGVVRNQTPLTVRGVTIRVQLLNDRNEPIASVGIEPLPHLLPNQSLPFRAEHLIRDFDRLHLVAEATATYNATDYLQIADWILARNLEQLKLWYVPIDESVLPNERRRVDEALAWLSRVDSTSPAWPEARRKWNLLQLSYGERLIVAKSLHEAILRLANVEAASPYYPSARTLIEQVRIQAIYERALQKAVAGHLAPAVRQMRKIPVNSQYAAPASQKLTQWQDVLKKRRIQLRPVPPPAYLKPAQRQIWLQMGNGPEGTTETRRGDFYRVTWWYPDYSYFTFDKEGRLVNSVVYNDKTLSE